MRGILAPLPERVKVEGTGVGTSRRPTFPTRHPVGLFLAFLFALGWPWLTYLTAHAVRSPVPYLAFTATLFGTAVTITLLADGVDGVRDLLSRLLIWRFPAAWWVLVVLAMPLMTVLMAGVTGTLTAPAGGWWVLVPSYLTATVTGAVTVNLAEETAWSGLVQTRLAQRRGHLVGALLTAPAFAAIHLPEQFTPGWTWPRVAAAGLLLLAVSVVFRYLLGNVLRATRGSLLAAGVLHASFNASGNLLSRGGWQFLPALLALTAGVLLCDRLASHRRHGCTPRPRTTTPPRKEG